MTTGFRAPAARALALFAAAALLDGCGADDAPQPEPVTQGEQRALADAAEMLDDRPAITPAITPTATPAE